MPGESIEARQKLERQIRAWLIFFIVGLVLSGLTALPLQTELVWLERGTRWLAERAPAMEGLHAWIARVREGLIETNARHPFLAYGTDWLAFSHLVIAVAFIGPLRDPVRNIWVIEFGMIACLMVIPFALIMGPIRGIPPYWRLIDCSFGVVGIVPLFICWKAIKKLEGLNAA